MLTKILNKISFLCMFIPRKLYYKHYKKRLNNPAPTIISNNCFGGLVYHNLGLKFNSPTINLFFSNEDFLTFVQNLKGYINAELIEISDPSRDYPVGQLTYNGETITIFFMHYKDFASARKKWNSRKKRIDYSNIFLIFQTITPTEDIIAKFESLPYKNKMLVTKNNPTNSKNIYTHEIMLKENYRFGEILQYKSRFSLHRYMDEIDYVGFLNTKN